MQDGRSTRGVSRDGPTPHPCGAGVERPCRLCRPARPRSAPVRPRGACCCRRCSPPSRPLSAEELAGEGDVASAYRNLEVLEELGLVAHVHLGHGPGRYQPAGRPRAYALCESCGEVSPLPPDGARRRAQAVLAPSATRARFTHFPLAGLCPACASEDGSMLTVSRLLTPAEWARAGGLAAAVIGLHVVGFGLLFGFVVPHHFGLGAGGAFTAGWA